MAAIVTNRGGIAIPQTLEVTNLLPKVSLEKCSFCNVPTGQIRDQSCQFPETGPQCEW